MGERKVLNKYHPADFDPSKIQRKRQPKKKQIKVRTMVPMRIRCNTCGTYISEGTKHNSRKEVVIGETYLGIQIFRLYFKCSNCSAELTIKTDPLNSDYVVESGAARNFEPWRNEEEAAERDKRKREEENMGDAMKSAENRALDSKQDMDDLAALAEMKSLKARHATVSNDYMLETLKRSEYEKEKRIMEGIDKADEEIIKSIIFQGSKDFVRRIHDDEDEDLDAALYQPSARSRQSTYDNSEGGRAIVAPSALAKPADALSKASVFNSSKDGETPGGSHIFKPKFIPRPRSSKKPTVDTDGRPKQESKSNLGGGSQTRNVLLSLCQYYNRDECD